MKIKMFLRNTRLLAYCACISMIMSLSACAGADEEIFAFEAVEVKMLSGWFSTDGGDISVDWGDGSVSKFSGKEKRYSKKYESKGNRKVTLTAANQGVLTGFRMDQTFRRFPAHREIIRHTARRPVRQRAGGGNFQHHPPADPGASGCDRSRQTDRCHRCLHPSAIPLFRRSARRAWWPSCRTARHPGRRTA